MNSTQYRRATESDCFPSIRVLRNYRPMTKEQYEKMKSVSMPTKAGLLLTVSKKLGFILSTKRYRVIINFTLEEVAHMINEKADPLGPGSAIFLLDHFTAQIIDDLLNATYAPNEELIKKLICGSEGETECLICLEKCTEKSYKTKCPCAYGCHEECLSTWLGKNGMCPVCRG